MDVLCSEVRKLVEENNQIKQGMVELATAVNNINNSAKLMEENTLLKHQLTLLQAKKNEYRSNLETVISQMSPNSIRESVKVDDSVRESVRGNLQERFESKGKRGESVPSTSGVVIMISRSIFAISYVSIMISRRNF